MLSLVVVIGILVVDKTCQSRIVSGVEINVLVALAEVFIEVLTPLRYTYMKTV